MGVALSDKVLSMGKWLKFLLLCSFLMNLPFASIAQTTENQVAFKKVQEATFDDTISNIAFGSFLKDGIERIYCKVIVLKDKEVQFLDTSGKIIARESLIANNPGEYGKYSGREAILSNKGNFVAIHDYIKQKSNIDYIVEDEYNIFDDKGKEIYKIKGPMYGTKPLDRMLISDIGGSVVGTRYEYGGIDFYSPSGAVKTVPLFGDLDWGSRMGWAILSGNNEYLAVVTLETPWADDALPHNKKGLWTILYDCKGKELWRTKMDRIVSLGSITFSEKGEYLVLRASVLEPGSDVAGKLTILYDKEGRTLTNIDTCYTSSGSICFSPHEDYVVLGKHNFITLMKTINDSIIFQKEWRLGNAELFSDDGKYLIARGKAKIGTEPVLHRGVEVMRPVYVDRVYILDMTGEQVWQNDFPELQRIFSEKGYLAFIMPHKYEIYKEDREAGERK